MIAAEERPGGGARLDEPAGFGKAEIGRDAPVRAIMEAGRNGALPPALHMGVGFEQRGFQRRLTPRLRGQAGIRSEEHTSELQSLMRISYAVFCLKKKKPKDNTKHDPTYNEK